MSTLIRGSRESQPDVLEIGRTSLGEDHPEFAERVKNLASLYRAMGRLGESHPDLAANFNYLAILYDLLVRFAEAVPVLVEDCRRKSFALHRRAENFCQGVRFVRPKS